MGVTLVSNIPLPSTQTQTQNVLANDSKGITQSLPKPEPARGKTARRDSDSGQDCEDQAGDEDERHQGKRPNRNRWRKRTTSVPYGQGGPVSGPYGTFNANGAKGGFGFTGGGGDFGSRYAWYVKVVQQKVSENWLKYEVDPRISTAQRVYITFDVMRDGHPANVQVEQSSGVPSLDQSATRAIQRIDTFGPLPSDYAANKVSVEFWFDYKR